MQEAVHHHPHLHRAQRCPTLTTRNTLRRFVAADFVSPSGDLSPTRSSSQRSLCPVAQPATPCMLASRNKAKALKDSSDAPYSPYLICGKISAGASSRSPHLLTQFPQSSVQILTRIQKSRGWYWLGAWSWEVEGEREEEWGGVGLFPGSVCLSPSPPCTTFSRGCSPTNPPAHTGRSLLEGALPCPPSVACLLIETPQAWTRCIATWTGVQP